MPKGKPQKDKVFSLNQVKHFRSIEEWFDHYDTVKSRLWKWYKKSPEYKQREQENEKLQASIPAEYRGWVLEPNDIETAFGALEHHLDTFNKKLSKKDAIRAAFLIGENITLLKLCSIEEEYRRGDINVQATRKGHTGRYGSSEKREAAIQKWQSDANKIYRENPKLSFEAVKVRVVELNRGTAYATTDRKLKRYLKNPKEKV
ncbi:MAG TPA: hypothetical protein V6C86_05705 [Oculatellaceae cyanobacterium]